MQQTMITFQIRRIQLRAHEQDHHNTYHVCGSDVETICAQAALHHQDQKSPNLLTHATQLSTSLLQNLHSIYIPLSLCFCFLWFKTQATACIHVTDLDLSNCPANHIMALVNIRRCYTVYDNYNCDL